MLRLLLCQKGYVLVGHSQQQPSIQEAYHHKPFAGAKRQLSLHNQSALGQRPRTRQKIELAKAAHHPDHQPQQSDQQKQNAHGLRVAAPGKGAFSKARAVFSRPGCGLPGQTAVKVVSKGVGKAARRLRGSAKPLARQFDGVFHHLVQPVRQRCRTLLHHAAHHLPRPARTCGQRRRDRAARNGLETATLEELATNAEVIAEIEAGLAEVMEPFNNAERVKKVKVVGEEWLPDSDLLTPTSKLKRRGINARYAAEIEALYR